MARLARVVAARVPHHVTQRGNRRQQVFFSDSDYGAYLALLAEGCRAAGVAVWAYCLMPNHVHLVLVPSDADGLRAALGEAHRRHTRRVNFREGWRGYLWQAASPRRRWTKPGCSPPRAMSSSTRCGRASRQCFALRLTT